MMQKEHLEQEDGSILSTHDVSTPASRQMHLILYLNNGDLFSFLALLEL
jgi:hypothetical protein